MRSEGDAKGKTPILLASVEMKGQQISQILSRFLTITKTKTAIQVVSLRFRYRFRYRFRKIYAPIVRIWLRRDEGC